MSLWEGFKRKFQELSDINRRFSRLIELTNEIDRAWKHGAIQEAMALSFQARDLLTQFEPHYSRPYIMSIQQLGLLYLDVGYFEEAMQFCQQAINIYQNTGNTDHSDYIPCLAALGRLHKEMGNYSESENYYQQAVNLYQGQSSVNYIRYVACLTQLAGLYHETKNFSLAEAYYQEALSVSQAKLGNNHHLSGISLKGLASIYRDIDRYAESEHCYLQAIEILKQDPDPRDYAGSLNSLAMLYSRIGNDNQAEKLYQQSLEIIGDRLGIDHPDYASGLNNLALLYLYMNRLSEVEPLYKQVIQIRGEQLGIDHPRYAHSLNNLALLYSQEGRVSEAEELYQQVISLLEAKVGTDCLDYAQSLNNLAFLCYATSRFSQAKEFYQKVIAIRKAKLGTDNSFYAESLSALAMVLVAQDNSDEALDLMKESAKIETHILGQIFSVSNDQQRLLYLEGVRDNVEKVLSLVIQYLPNSAEAKKAAFDLVLSRKALATEAAMIQRIAFLSGRYPQLAPQLKQMEQLANQITQLTFDVPSSAQELSTYQECLATLYRQQDELERELSRLIPEMNLQKQLDLADCRAVAMALPQVTTLVEFVRFKVYNFKAIRANGDSRWNEAHYLAFILSANQPEQIQMIDLGEAESIDPLIQAFRHDVFDGRGLDFGEISDSNDELELRQKVFDPLKPYLTSQIFISPDGELNCLPFGLLPKDEEGYLMEQYTISYLSAGRDLLRFFQEGKIKQEKLHQIQPTKSLVLANPDYNLSQEEDNNSSSISRSFSSISNSINSQIYQDIAVSREKGVFSPLPASQIEGEKVAALLGVKAHTDIRALKSKISKCQSPLILHIATHGYFLRNIEQQPLDFFGDLLTENQRLNWVAQHNPQVRSGLAFSGVNTMLQGGKLPEEAEDGLLTSHNAANINLVATELVVTSACETALGDIQVGEGVAGLRRAFMLAGAQTLVMSLWNVPDLSTVILMEHFYHYLLQDKLGRAESLIKAQFDVRNLTVGELRSEWLTPEVISNSEYLKSLINKKDDYCPFEHPSYWGAFICIGNSASLNLSKYPTPN